MIKILFSWLSIPRAIGIWIDSIAFSLVDNLYDLIVEFSTLEFFSEETIKSIMQSTYTVISIFALFRIAIILVNAIINPDKLTDSKNGFLPVLRNFVLMFVLLVLTPRLFTEAYKIQSTIVEGNYIQKLFLRSSAKDTNPGDELKKIVISSLVYPDKTFATYDVKEGKYIVNKDCDGNCEKAVNAYNDDVLANKNGMFVTLSKYIGTSKKIDTNNDGDKETVYVYNYMFFVTFAAGIFITYVLASMGLDIAIRAVELAVLQIISPLFIVTMIDPKSVQSGPFKKWLQTVGKTYVSLFIKIAILTLMIKLISIVNTASLPESLGFLGKLVAVLAILIFAKKAPKWIGDMVGVEGDSAGLGGLGKKLGSAALVGGAISKGLDKGKKEAKRVGAGMFNRVGADVGGSLAGIQSAKRNALGDKSLRSIRENEMKSSGSKIKANAAAVKSFFNKDDRDARKEALRNAKADGSLDLKNAAKEGMLRARVEGTDAALDGNFKSAGSLSRSVKKTYDPNYKTHDERVRSDAESKYYSNAGAFNISEIERQKKVQQDLDESRKILGRQTYADEKGDIYLDEAHSMPAIYNEKTLKKFVGEYATNYGDLGTGVIFGAEKGVLMTDSDKTLTINDNGTLRELNVPAGTLLKEKIVDQNGKKVISYEALTENGTFKDKNGNAVDVNLANSSQIRQTADGYEVIDGNNKVVMKARQNRDQAGNVIGVELSNSNGQIVNNSTDSNGNVVLAASKILTEYGMQYAGKTANGKDDSVLAKQLDAAFASMKDKIAANVVKYEGDIGSVKQHKIELQTKLTQQQEQILQISNNTQYGKAITKLQEINRNKSHETDRLQQFTAWLDSMVSSGNDSINVGGYTYSKDEVERLRSESAKKLRDLSETESELNSWINNNPDEKTKHDSIITGLRSSINEIIEALEETDKDISVLEAEKNKIDKVASPLRIDGEIINSNNYNNHSEKLSKDVEKFKKIADGSMGEFPSKSNE